MPIADHGSEDLKNQYLPNMASGHWIGANAITEAEAGSDAFALTSSATRDGDDYVLSGTKSYVSNGPVADVFLVFARTSPKRGYMGIDAFVVERGYPGVTVGQAFPKMGLTTSPISSLYLEDVRVPAVNRLGDREGYGASIFTRSMHWERTCMFAGYLGLLDRQLEECVRYANERKQFRQVIAKYQAISHRLVEMRLRLESARLLLYHACWLRDRGETAELEVALSKLAISEAAVASSLDAIQIFGGAGFMHEFGVERFLRDSIPSRIFSGTSEIQRNIIAAHMGLPP